MKLIFFSVSIFFFFGFWVVRRQANFEASLRHGNHSEVFDLLSDVGRLPLLNPTMTKVESLSRAAGSDFDFAVDYEERLWQVPSVRNRARGLFRVFEEPGGGHSLASRHLTCFFGDFLCLSTDSVLRIRQKSETVVTYEEEISFDCPWILTPFCFREVTAQRQLILSNLRRIISQKPKSV